MLGIELSDLNVLSVPLLVTDLYGEFERGENGFPQLMTISGPVEGNPTAPIDAMSGLSAGRAFLDDIAHNAVPGTFVVDRMTGETAQKIADEDDLAGNVIIYVPGLIWLGMLYGWDKPILQWGLTPFLIGDALKLALAAALLPALWKLVGRARG